MIFIGIDPGTTGAIATINGTTKEIRFFDTPTFKVKSGKTTKNVHDCAAMARFFREIARLQTYVVIEKVNAMPGTAKNGERQSMGATSAFSFGMGFGMWLGILATCKTPHAQVAPVTWKKAMMADMDKAKDASRIKAIQLFPETAQDLTLKKHHGRADALLMAEYGRRNYKE